MRYLFCSFSAYGFIYPLLGIAQQLRARGHEIQFVTGMDFGRIVADAGFERIPRGPKGDGQSFFIRFAGHPLETARQVKHVEHAIRVYQPDIIVGHELALGPLVAARRHKIPIAMMGLATYVWPSEANLISRPHAAERLHQRYAGFEESYNISQEMFHLQQADGVEPLIGDLFLLRSVPEMEPLSQHLPPQVRLVGDCLWEPASDHDDPQLQAWIENAKASGHPILYAQPGRLYDAPQFWQSMIDALLTNHFF